MTSPISGSSPSKSKEKMCFSSSDVCEEYMTSTVEELLAAAYMNLLNSSKEQHEEFLLDCMDSEVAHEMVEEFLDSAYNNLLNYFNDEKNVPQGN
jgi:hypothetical protein